MEENKKILLAQKRKETELKLYAREYVKRRITFHWLDILTSIANKNIQYKIEYLCSVTKELYPYFVDAINEINHPLLSADLIRVDEITMMDSLFDQYPSVEALKYMMSLPVILSSNQDFNTIIHQDNNLKTFFDEPVYFLSPDWSPLIILNWKEVIEKGEEVFSNIPLAYIFTNANNSKILFKSIEDEWRTQ